MKLYSNYHISSIFLTIVTRTEAFSFNPSLPTVPCRTNSDAFVSQKQTRLQMSIPTAIDTVTSGFCSIARLPFGTNVISPSSGEGNKYRIKALYDIEQSKECRQVRERITELDLVVEKVIPAASNSRALNDESYKYFFKGDTGNSNIPIMVIAADEEEDQTLVGVDNIMDFLNNAYGSRDRIIDDVDEIRTKAAEFLIEVGSYMPQILRYGRGESVATCALPNCEIDKPLILYSYEGNQFCRLVREVLTELDLPYELRSAGKGSPRRVELGDITGGSTQCPFLIDPNADIKMSESKDIIEYLYKKYGLYTPPSELLGQISYIITPLLKPVYKVLTPLQAGSNRDDKAAYDVEISRAKAEIEEEIQSGTVVIYTYSLSPFCTEAIGVLENLDIDYKEISLGAEWVPFLINEGGSQKRAALAELTGQSSLPHIFVDGKSIGGLYEGLLPALEDGRLSSLI